MKLLPDELQHIPHIDFCNTEKLRNAEFAGVSTDSRTVREGELFVALRGENFDGHKFLAEAFEKGCAAAIVDGEAKLDPVQTMPLLIVDDTTRALGELAHYYRTKFDVPIIAIGGSNGKTTTKEMVNSVLSAKYRVLCTEGNLNNHIGVPQTLFRLEKKHQIAVVEIGTNHPGEIKHLCNIIEPTHGLITNIGREHLEFFKTLTGVAKEEGALFDWLAKRKGAIAFVNAGDKRLLTKAKNVKTKVLYGYGTKRVSVRGTIIDKNESGGVKFSFSVKSAKRAVTVQLTIPGEHNAHNALSAAAVGLTFKVPAQKIKSALEKLPPASKRMELVNINGIIVYNDAYNANPDSMSEALRTLASAAVAGKRIAVLADMKELGEASQNEHARIGKGIQGIDYVLTFGEMAKHIHDASTVASKFHYDQKNMLAEYLCELASPGDAILVKGSRSMKMEDVVIFMQERLKQSGEQR